MNRQHMGRGEESYVRLPRPAPVVFNMSNFVPCPVPCCDLGLFRWQQELYQWAFAQAQAVAQPSILERDLLAVWN